MYFVADAIPDLVYVRVAGEDKLIVVMHVVLPVILNLTAKRNSAIDKAKKVKRPTVCRKIVVVIEKKILLQKIWMMLLPAPPLIGIMCLRSWKTGRFLALDCTVAAIFVVDRVKL